MASWTCLIASIYGVESPGIYTLVSEVLYLFRGFQTVPLPFRNAEDAVD